MDSNSFILTGKDSDLKFNLNTPIYLDPEKSYELALINLDTYNSIHNITPKNNEIQYTKDGGATWETVAIDPGSYEINDMNKFIKTKIARNGGNKDAISILPNNNTLKTNLIITDANYGISFSGTKSLAPVLGYELGEYMVTQESPNIVDIMNVNTIFVHADIIGNSYVNNDTQPTLYSFYPDSPPGFKIIEAPHNLIYLPVTTNIIRSLRVWLTTQTNEPLNLNGETLTVRLHLRSKN